MALFLAPLLLWAEESRIITIAGADVVRDGATGGEAILENVTGLAVAPDGSLLIADSTSARIRKVTPSREQPFLERMYFNGRMETIAGRGGAFYNGDELPATEAFLSRPGSIAMDAAGNLIIADTGNNRIRAVGPDGVIRTLAAAQQPFGVAVSSDGVVHFSEPGAGLVRRINADGSLESVGRFAAPLGLAFDHSGNLLVVESGLHAIRKVSPDGVITTVAGMGQAGFSGDGGPAAEARLANPRSVAVNAAGEIHIADAGNIRIRRIRTDGVIETVLQLAPASALAFDGDGNLFIAFTAQVNVLRATDAGLGAPIVGGNGSGRDGRAAAETVLLSPAAAVTARGGEVYISDPRQGSIRFIDSTGVLRTLNTGPMRNPTGLAMDAQGRLWIAETASQQVRRRDPDGAITVVAGNGTLGTGGDGGPATEAQLRAPSQIAVDRPGRLLIVDADRVRIVSPEGIIETLAGVGAPVSGIAAGSDGYFFAGDPTHARLMRITIEGEVTTIELGENAEGMALRPRGIAAADDDTLYFTSDHSVYRRAGDGSITRIAGGVEPGFAGDGGPATEARFNNPTRLTLDSNGALVIVDAGNHRIRHLSLPVKP
ncbi:MAG: hypothetical protein SFV51_23295 [Bryobacteraceae bacterium]|nr:hypothetical protein [Bryobacteraceae bacterium]